uniref:Ig-like domain-containing protein n=1 Tax=Anopheles culicifacies TaxID=139723 RepID=A0A182MKV5_9DIPT
MAKLLENKCIGLTYQLLELELDWSVPEVPDVAAPVDEPPGAVPPDVDNETEDEEDDEDDEEDGDIGRSCSTGSDVTSTGSSELQHFAGYFLCMPVDAGAQQNLPGERGFGVATLAYAGKRQLGVFLHRDEHVACIEPPGIDQQKKPRAFSASHCHTPSSSSITFEIVSAPSGSRTNRMSALSRTVSCWSAYTSTTLSSTTWSSDGPRIIGRSGRAWGSSATKPSTSSPTARATFPASSLRVPSSSGDSRCCCCCCSALVSSRSGPLRKIICSSKFSRPKMLPFASSVRSVPREGKRCEAPPLSLR